jgi:hypothetical protein
MLIFKLQYLNLYFASLKEFNYMKHIPIRIQFVILTILNTFI